ncbi:hypothetical protein Ahy_A09g043581 [Arachis hypogaea]|uniref:Myb/SANT-like domain-containing protein n=1 Tax=Arachis hypogaea TaxID=3818 RepID=A0A445BIM3_ARAHY|nr:hypothetical protein Ahy_A09g043581 [Arachis hypogaea]
MDEVLLNALIEEVLKGNRHDGSWTTKAYDNIVKTLSIEIGPHITKNYIKNKMKTLKDYFTKAYDLFHHLSGFAWNHVTRKFKTKEEVWQDFIKLNQLGGTSTSRGTKCKSPMMNDFLEAQYEKVALEITTTANAVKEGSYLSSKLHDVAQRQVESIERQASVTERQVSVAKK